MGKLSQARKTRHCLVCGHDFLLVSSKELKRHFIVCAAKTRKLPQRRSAA